MRKRSKTVDLRTAAPCHDAKAVGDDSNSETQAESDTEESHEVLSNRRRISVIELWRRRERKSLGQQQASDIPTVQGSRSFPNEKSWLQSSTKINQAISEELKAPAVHLLSESSAEEKDNSTPAATKDATVAPSMNRRNVHTGSTRGIHRSPKQEAMQPLDLLARRRVDVAPLEIPLERRDTDGPELATIDVESPKQSPKQTISIPSPLTKKKQYALRRRADILDMWTQSERGNVSPSPPGIRRSPASVASVFFDTETGESPKSKDIEKGIGHTPHTKEPSDRPCQIQPQSRRSLSVLDRWKKGMIHTDDFSVSPDRPPSSHEQEKSANLQDKPMDARTDETNEAVASQVDARQKVESAANEAKSVVIKSSPNSSPRHLIPCSRYQLPHRPERASRTKDWLAPHIAAHSESAKQSDQEKVPRTGQPEQDGASDVDTVKIKGSSLSMRARKAWDTRQRSHYVDVAQSAESRSGERFSAQSRVQISSSGDHCEAENSSIESTSHKVVCYPENAEGINGESEINDQQSRRAYVFPVRRNLEKSFASVMNTEPSSQGDEKSLVATGSNTDRRTYGPKFAHLITEPSPVSKLSSPVDSSKLRARSVVARWTNRSSNSVSNSSKGSQASSVASEEDDEVSQAEANAQEPAIEPEDFSTGAPSEVCLPQGQASTKVQPNRDREENERFTVVASGSLREDEVLDDARTSVSDIELRPYDEKAQDRRHKAIYYEKFQSLRSCSSAPTEGYKYTTDNASYGQGLPSSMVEQGGDTLRLDFSQETVLSSRSDLSTPTADSMPQLTLSDSWSTQPNGRQSAQASIGSGSGSGSASNRLEVSTKAAFYASEAVKLGLGTTPQNFPTGSNRSVPRTEYEKPSNHHEKGLGVNSRHVHLSSGTRTSKPNEVHSSTSRQAEDERGPTTPESASDSNPQQITVDASFEYLETNTAQDVAMSAGSQTITNPKDIQFDSSPWVEHETQQELGKNPPNFAMTASSNAETSYNQFEAPLVEMLATQESLESLPEVILTEEESTHEPIEKLQMRLATQESSESLPKIPISEQRSESPPMILLSQEPIDCQSKVQITQENSDSLSQVITAQEPSGAVPKVPVTLEPNRGNTPKVLVALETTQAMPKALVAQQFVEATPKMVSNTSFELAPKLFVIPEQTYDSDSSLKEIAAENPIESHRVQGKVSPSLSSDSQTHVADNIKGDCEFRTRLDSPGPSYPQSSISCPTIERNEEMTGSPEVNNVNPLVGSVAVGLAAMNSTTTERDTLVRSAEAFEANETLERILADEDNSDAEAVLSVGTVEAQATLERILADDEKTATSETVVTTESQTNGTGVNEDNPSDEANVPHGDNVAETPDVAHEEQTTLAAGVTHEGKATTGDPRVTKGVIDNSRPFSVAAAYAEKKKADSTTNMATGRKTHAERMKSYVKRRLGKEPTPSEKPPSERRRNQRQSYFLKRSKLRAQRRKLDSPNLSQQTTKPGSPGKPPSDTVDQCNKDTEATNGTNGSNECRPKKKCNIIQTGSESATSVRNQDASHKAETSCHEQATSESGHSDTLSFFSHAGSAFSGFTAPSSIAQSAFTPAHQRLIEQAQDLTKRVLSKSEDTQKETPTVTKTSSVQWNDATDESSEAQRNECSGLASRYNTSSRFLDVDSHATCSFAADNSTASSAIMSSHANSTYCSEASRSFDSAASGSEMYTSVDDANRKEEPSKSGVLQEEISEAFQNAYQSFDMKKLSDNVSGSVIGIDLHAITTGLNSASESLRKLVDTGANAKCSKCRPDSICQGETTESNPTKPTVKGSKGTDATLDEGIAIEVEYVSDSDDTQTEMGHEEEISEAFSLSQSPSGDSSLVYLGQFKLGAKV